MSRYREAQAKTRGAWIIPAANDIESMADFFEDHPDWSPALNEDGVPTGVVSPMIWFPEAWQDGA